MNETYNENNLPEYLLERVYLPTETLGSIYSPSGELIAKSMELPWRNNQRDDPNTPENDASCVPEGTYILEKMPPKEDRPYWYFRFRAIPGRSIHPTIKDKLGKLMSSILMHRITYVKDLLGCIGIGSRFEDLNKDGVPDMVESSKKLQWMTTHLPEVFKLKIIKKA